MKQSTRKDETLVVINYYENLSYVDRIKFKSKVIETLKVSAATFHRRILANDLKPGELLLLEELMENKSYL